MRTLILLAALTLLSCKKETPQPTLCTCVDVTYQRSTTQSDVWFEHSRKEPQQEDCWRHGETRYWQTSPVAWVTVFWKESKHCE